MIWAIAALILSGVAFGFALSNRTYYRAEVLRLRVQERRYQDRERGMLTEMHDAEAVLAEALGYVHDPEFGWVIGDHTVTTLAMEARRKLIPAEEDGD